MSLEDQQRGGAGGMKPRDLSADTRPPLRRRAFTGDSQIHVQSVLRALTLRHLQQGQPRRNTGRVVQPRSRQSAVRGLTERLHPVRPRRKWRGRWFVHVPCGDLPELGESLRVSTVQSEIHPDQHAVTVAAAQRARGLPLPAGQTEAGRRRIGQNCVDRRPGIAWRAYQAPLRTAARAFRAPSPLAIGPEGRMRGSVLPAAPSRWQAHPVGPVDGRFSGGGRSLAGRVGAGTGGGAQRRPVRAPRVGRYADARVRHARQCGG
jgi:hypothetical protein